MLPARKREDMTCRIVNGTIVCGPKDRTVRCGWCLKECTRLCDFPVARKARAMKVTGRGKTRARSSLTTCSAPMCDDHRKEIGPNVDYCPTHREAGLEL